MVTTVAQMSREEFKVMIEEIVEQKFLEMLGDPDEGLEIRESVQNRLIRGACNRWGGRHLFNISGNTCHFEWSVAE